MAKLVKVTFLPLGKTVEVDLDQMPYKGHGKPESCLAIALNHGLHLEHACGGNCACTTCHVVVKQGKELLSEAEDDELDRLDLAADLCNWSRAWAARWWSSAREKSWWRFLPGTATSSAKAASRT